MNTRPVLAVPALLVAALAVSAAALAEPAVLIVQGLGGNAHYEERFTAEADAIATAAATLPGEPAIRLLRGEEATREAIIGHLGTLEAELTGDDALYVYLVGHGSFDDEEYKFNIPGPDLTDVDLLSALEAITNGPQIVINTSSASGAAADVWQREDRVVITATRSGGERHATLFGQHFAEALTNPSADLDKNRIITAREAFNFADRRVADHFETNGNLPTEHARLDGERAGRITLARLDAGRPAPSDPALAALLERRDEVAGRIDTLRQSRDERSRDAYQAELLDLMLELAAAEEAIEVRESELAGGDRQ